MDAAPANAEPLRAIESLLAFWADAGVEAIYGDTPVDRSAAQARPHVAKPLAAPPTPGKPSASTPVRADATANPSAVALAAAAHDLDDLTLAAATAAGVAWEGYSFHRGDPQGVVMVVVDAPDDDDRREGRPASGAKGRLLDRMLVAAALDGRVAIVNAALINTALGSSETSPGGSDPGAFAPFVERALVLVRPRLVVAAGAAAARLFFPADQSIPRLRGSWADWRHPDLDVSTPVLATFSPTLLLAQPAAKKLAWRDIMTLQERLETLSASDLP